MNDEIRSEPFHCFIRHESYYHYHEIHLHLRYPYWN